MSRSRICVGFKCKSFYPTYDYYFARRLRITKDFVLYLEFAKSRFFLDGFFVNEPVYDFLNTDRGQPLVEAWRVKTNNNPNSCLNDNGRVSFSYWISKSFESQLLATTYLNTMQSVRRKNLRFVSLAATLPNNDIIIY